MKTTKNIVQIKSPREGVGLCGRATIGIFSCKLKKNHKPVPDEIHRPRQRDLDISLNGIESYCIELTYHRRTKEKNIPISFAPMYSVTRKVIHYYFMKL